MADKIIKITLLASLLTLSACSSLQSNTPSDRDITIFPVATAIRISYQDEVTLLKLNQLILTQKQLTATQKAELFYRRGLIYDRMGLLGHAQLNYREAVDADPSYGPAYNGIGVYWLSAQKYDQAFEAFDSAIELNGAETFSFLHRAVGLSQIGKYDLASRDIEQFYKMSPNDPYRIIWRYLINSHLDNEKALLDLKSLTKPTNTQDKRFAWHIVAFLAGDLSEGELLQLTNKNVSSNRKHAERLAEVYFYLGYWHREQGELSKAIYYYQMTTGTNVQEFIEYKYAYMELALIDQQLLREREAQQEIARKEALEK